MTSSYLRLSALLILVAGLVGAGCGGDDESSSTAAESTSTSSGKTLEIAMDDYSFSPADATATAGTTTITAPNQGGIEHELVVFKTNADPAQLPTGSDGAVDEDKLAAEAQSAGEITDVAPGDTGEGEFELTPGTYVLFCNLPGHYVQGMYGALTVK